MDIMILVIHWHVVFAPILLRISMSKSCCIIPAISLEHVKGAFELHENLMVEIFLFSIPEWLLSDSFFLGNSLINTDKSNMLKHCVKSNIVFSLASVNAKVLKQRWKIGTYNYYRFQSDQGKIRMKNLTKQEIYVS